MKLNMIKSMLLTIVLGATDYGVGQTYTQNFDTNVSPFVTGSYSGYTTNFSGTGSGSVTSGALTMSSGSSYEYSEISTDSNTMFGISSFLGTTTLRVNLGQVTSNGSGSYFGIRLGAVNFILYNDGYFRVEKSGGFGTIAGNVNPFALNYTSGTTGVTLDLTMTQTADHSFNYSASYTDGNSTYNNSYSATTDAANYGKENQIAFFTESTLTTTSYFDNLSVVTVPEPSTWLCLVLGLGLVCVSVRRNKSSKI